MKHEPFFMQIGDRCSSMYALLSGYALKQTFSKQAVHSFEYINLVDFNRPAMLCCEYTSKAVYALILSFHKFYKANASRFDTTSTRIKRCLNAAGLLANYFELRENFLVERNDDESAPKAVALTEMIMNTTIEHHEIFDLLMRILSCLPHALLDLLTALTTFEKALHGNNKTPAQCLEMLEPTILNIDIDTFDIEKFVNLSNDDIKIKFSAQRFIGMAMRKAIDIFKAQNDELVTPQNATPEMLANVDETIARIAKLFFRQSRISYHDLKNFGQTDLIQNNVIAYSDVEFNQIIDVLTPQNFLLFATQHALDNYQLEQLTTVVELFQANDKTVYPTDTFESQDDAINQYTIETICIRFPYRTYCILDAACKPIVGALCESEYFHSILKTIDTAIENDKSLPVVSLHINKPNVNVASCESHMVSADEYNAIFSGNDNATQDAADFIEYILGTDSNLQ